MFDYTLRSLPLASTTQAIVISRDGTWTIHLPDLNLSGHSTKAPNVHGKDGVHIVGGSISYAAPRLFTARSAGLVSAVIDFTDVEARASLLDSAGGTVATFTGFDGFWGPCHAVIEDVEFAKGMPSDEP